MISLKQVLEKVGVFFFGGGGGVQVGCRCEVYLEVRLLGVRPKSAQGPVGYPKGFSVL